jgi:tetratricopeptide (TPR) repeat protein
MDPVPRRREALAGAGVLAAVTAAVFWPSLKNGFIELYDDGPYVLANAVVRRGLDWQGVRWALTAVHSHNWHPLTWVSHMADVQLFGLDPWGHHLTSVLLHALNAALVGLLLAGLGMRPAGALLAGALFALHPLRVQSVAWVSERKDVLAAFFGLAAALLYVRAIRRDSRPAYLASLVLFALGLLSKPMLVTLPAVLILLDAWPLSRAGLDPQGEGSGRPWRWGRALVQKIPYALMSLGVAWIAVRAQGGTGAIAPAEDLPWAARTGNAAVSVFAYLLKTVWPSGLSVFYPHPGDSLSGWAVAAAVVGLAGLTAGAIGAWPRAPWLLVGWLWWLVTLLPVLGILQVGRQAMADRYTYLPSVGLLIAAAFSVQALAGGARRRWPAWALASATAAAVAALALTTRHNLALWRDSGTLFRHAMAVTERNAVAANALGVLEAREGHLDAALRLYRRAVEFDPRFAAARQNLAGLLYALGRDAEGWGHAVEAARLDPRNPQARFVLGLALEARGLPAEAAAEYEAALALRPDYENARVRLEALKAAGAALR